MSDIKTLAAEYARQIEPNDDYSEGRWYGRIEGFIAGRESLPKEECSICVNCKRIWIARPLHCKCGHCTFESAHPTQIVNAEDRPAPKEDMVKAMEAAIVSHLNRGYDDYGEDRGLDEQNEAARACVEVAQTYLSPLEAENKRLKEAMQEAADHLFNMPTECLLDAKLVIGQANIMLSKALNNI